MKNIINKTKARTLQWLREELPTVNILPLKIITGYDLQANSEQTALMIQQFFAGLSSHIIVRSSCSNEDSIIKSNAGKFESILNVSINDNAAIIEAMQKVYSSYGQVDINEEILIQPMLQDVACSGVVFTRDMETLAPYYTITMHQGEDTSIVTGGSSECIKTLIRYKFAKIPIGDTDIEAILSACVNIEKFMDNDALDIEFGITKSHELYIFPNLLFL